MIRFLILCLVFSSCNSKKTEYVTLDNPVEIKEVEKEVIVEKEIEITKEVNQPFEGIFGCPNNGLIELYEDSQGRVYIESQGWQLTSVNPKGLNGISFAVHPKMEAKKLPKKNNAIKFEKDISYSSGSNVREDVNNNIVTGLKRTKLSLKVLETGIKVKIEVFNKKIGESEQIRIVKRELICE